MKKIIGILIIVIIIVGVISWSSKRTPQSSLQKITISEAFPVFLHSPLWVAAEKGYFEDEGLDVTITTAGGDEKAFAAVLSNEAQFAVGDPIFVAVAGEKGQPGKVIAGMLNGVAFWGVAGPDVPQIKTPAELKGYTVATLPAPSTNYALQVKMFQSGGLKPFIKEVEFGGLLPALEAKQVDIALEFEPQVSIAVKNGNHIVYSLSDYYPDFAFTGVTALPEYIENNPEIVQKITNALQKAHLLIINDPESAADAILKRFGEVDRTVAINALTNMAKSNVILPDVQTSKEAWDEAVKARMEVGDLKVAAPFELYVDNSFAEKSKSIK